MFYGQPLKGFYTGVVHTSNNDIPITIQFTSPEEISVSINNNKQVTVSNANWSDNHLRFDIPGDLNIPTETGNAPYTLHVSVFAKGIELYGAVVTLSLSDFKTPNLPFWVHLNKQ